MGLNLGANILTSGFLVTVIIFFVLMGILFYNASIKMGEVLLNGDSRSNNLEKLDSAYNATRVAYSLAFIAAIISLLLALLYAGHETVISPSEYWHLALYLITYILLVISVIYAFIALTRIYSLEIRDRNGADAFLWSGLLMSIFAFVGLTATGSGRLGMNIMRDKAASRVNKAECLVNEHLPSVRNKIDELHSGVFGIPMEETHVITHHGDDYSCSQKVPTHEKCHHQINAKSNQTVVTTKPQSPMSSMGSQLPVTNRSSLENSSQQLVSTHQMVSQMKPIIPMGSVNLSAQSIV